MTGTIDHFMYAVPDLDEGIRWATKVFGVAPAYGGEHLGLGTRNALLSLGTTYLEIIAPDPAQKPGKHLGHRFAQLNAGGLVTWAVQGELRAIAAALKRIDVRSLGPNRTERRTADGQLLVWELLFPAGTPYGPRMPFFIDWLDCTHPSAANPVGGEFATLAISDPNADSLQPVLDALQIDVTATQGAAAMRVEIQAANGAVVLESTRETAGIRMGQ